MRPLTNGELSTWRRCHRKWWLQWERGLRPLRDEDPDDGSPRATGTRVHEALMWHQRGRPDLMNEAIADCELSRIMVDGYLDYLAQEGPDQGVTWTDTERVVEADYHGIKLSGKVDRKGQDADGRWFVDDYKTVGSMDQFNRWSTMMTQPKHYMCIEWLKLRRDPGWEGRFRYTLLKRVKRTIRAKPPFYGVHHVYHTAREIKEYLRMVSRVVTEMDEERAELLSYPRHVPYPTPTRDCSWDCDFFGVCPMFDQDRKGAEVVLRLSYKEGDPLAHHEEVVADGA